MTKQKSTFDATELIREKPQHIYDRIVQTHQASAKYPSTITGHEREIIISALLNEILPAGCRIGSGLITDYQGNSSGQTDVVIEMPFSVSFPVSSTNNRLYLADGIGAAIEIKSNLSSQIDEAKEKINSLYTLTCTDKSNPKVPIYLIAYKGPTKQEVLQGYVRNNQWTKKLRGMLIINPPYFWGTGMKGEVYEAKSEGGCIFAFICSLLESLKTKERSTISTKDLIEMFNRD